MRCTTGFIAYASIHSGVYDVLLNRLSKCEAPTSDPDILREKRLWNDMLTELHANMQQQQKELQSMQQASQARPPPDHGPQLAT